jgi:hypothetical protein
MLQLMYSSISSAFCSVGLQAHNLKSPNLSLDEVYQYLMYLTTSVRITNTITKNILFHTVR